jgi:outer membrane biosynthesis protein TonB
MRPFAIVLAITSFGLLDSSWLPAQQVVTEHSATSKSQKINSVRIPPYRAESMTQRTVLPKDLGIPGDAVLEITVNNNGRVIKVRGVSGDSRLISATKPAIMKWVFAPYLLNGEPVQFSTELTIQFDGKKHMARLQTHPDPLTERDR